MSQLVGEGLDYCTFSLEDGSVVKSSEVHAVWYRKPGLPRLHPKTKSHELEFVFSESREGLRGLYDALRHAYWISPLENINTASNKLRQLRRASSLGLTVPRTVYTNDATTARAFISDNGGRVIYKSIGDGALFKRAGKWDAGTVVGEIYTTLLDQSTIELGISRLSTCPAFFQEYIEKDVELRVTVVGRSVFAAELDSQSHDEARIDWRRGDVLAMEHRVHNLPVEVRQKCVSLVEQFHLEFGAIDMIKCKDGRYVFLELNPNGQYLWIEDLTGLKISRAIAEQLMRGHAAAIEIAP
jgi:glutathione synthase/RimK-type ligase-like ATP-grasp enzyme